MELRRVGVLLHAELLQRVDRGLDPGAALVLLGDVDAVEQEARLTPLTPPMMLPLTISGRTSCEFPLGGKQRHPGVSRASS